MHVTTIGYIKHRLAVTDSTPVYGGMDRLMYESMTEWKSVKMSVALLQAKHTIQIKLISPP